MRKSRSPYVLCITLLLSFIIGCKQRSSLDIFANKQIDSIYSLALDSIYHNNAFSKNLFRSYLNNSKDSFSYFKFLTAYSKCCFASGQFDSVFYWNNQIFSFLAMADSSLRRDVLYSQVYNLQGNALIQLGYPDSAIEAYSKAYFYALKNPMQGRLADVSVNLADGYVHKNNYAYAAYYYKRALFFNDSLNLPTEKNYPIYCGLGQVYMDMGDFDKSDYYFDMAEQYFETRSTYERFFYLNNRACYYYFRNDFENALVYLRNALHEVSSNEQMEYERNLCKANLGELYLLMGKLDSASLCINESESYFSDLKNLSVLYYLETQKVELAILQGKIGEANKLLQRAEPEGFVDTHVKLIRNRYLINYFEKIGDYKKAYELLQKDREMLDSIRDERTMARIQEIDMRYHHDTIVMSRERMIEKQKGRVRLLSMSVGLWVTICVALLLLLVLSLYSFKRRKEYLLQKHINQITRLRMENIRNHVSPHFVFNVLNWEISRSQSIGYNPHELISLVKLLRKSLLLTAKQSISLTEELDFVRTYLELEGAHLGDNFTSSIDVETGINEDAVQVLPMIIQIPVENALKHGLKGLQRDKKLVVKVRMCTKGTIISIKDNGRGYAPSSLCSAQNTGTGLRTINQAIQLLNAHNKLEAIRFEVDHQQAVGTVVNIFIPTNYSFEI